MANVFVSYARGDRDRIQPLVATRQALESDCVQDEAEEARQRGVLIPVMLEPVKPSAGFRQVQAADVSQWTGARDHREFRALALAAKGLAALASEGAGEVRAPLGKPVETKREAAFEPVEPAPTPAHRPAAEIDPEAAITGPPPTPRPFLDRLSRLALLIFAVVGFTVFGAASLGVYKLSRPTGS